MGHSTILVCTILIKYYIYSNNRYDIDFQNISNFYSYVIINYINLVGLY